MVAVWVAVAVAGILTGLAGVGIGASTVLDIDLFNPTSHYQSVYPGNLGDALENTVFPDYCAASSNVERAEFEFLRDRTIVAHKYELGTESWHFRESGTSGDRICWSEDLKPEPEYLGNRW